MARGAHLHGSAVKQRRRPTAKDQDLSIFDYDSNGRHQPMGEVINSVREMVKLNGAPMNVIKPSKRKYSSYTNSETLMARNARLPNVSNIPDVCMSAQNVLQFYHK